MASTAAMAGMRVLIGWVYSHTKSLPPAQLMHMSSTGSLALLSPASISPGKEAFWYAISAVMLWVPAAVAGTRFAPKEAIE